MPTSSWLIFFSASLAAVNCWVAWASSARHFAASLMIEQGFDERVLNGILDGREVCSTTDEDADHGGDELTQLRLGEGIRIDHRGLRSLP